MHSFSNHGRAVALNVSINLSVTPHPAAMTTPRSDSPRIRQSGPLRAPSHRASGSQDHSASGRQDHSQFLALVLATTRCWNSLGGVPVWHVRVDLVPPTTYVKSRSQNAKKHASHKVRLLKLRRRRHRRGGAPNSLYTQEKQVPPSGFFY